MDRSVGWLLMYVRSMHQFKPRLDRQAPVCRQHAAFLGILCQRPFASEMALLYFASFWLHKQCTATMCHAWANQVRLCRQQAPSPWTRTQRF